MNLEPALFKLMTNFGAIHYFTFICLSLPQHKKQPPQPQHKGSPPKWESCQAVSAKFISCLSYKGNPLPPLWG